MSTTQAALLGTTEPTPIPDTAEIEAVRRRYAETQAAMDKACAALHEATQAHLAASKEQIRVSALTTPLDWNLLHFLIDISCGRRGHTLAAAARYSYRTAAEVMTEMERIIAAGPVDWHGGRYVVRFDGKQYAADRVTTP